MRELDEIRLLLGRIDERTARTGEQVDNLEAAVFRGNGRPSVLARLELLESGEARRSIPDIERPAIGASYWRALAGIVVAIVVAVSGLLGARALGSTPTPSREAHAGP